MHPFTVHDAAVREHRRAVAERARDRQLVNSRDERTVRGTVVVRPPAVRAVRRAPTTSTSAQGTVPGTAQRPTADARSAAGPLAA